MLEILILYTLQEHSNSIYGIKKELERRFSHLMTFSFGSLHPVLKKLEKLKVINVKKDITDGGKRKFLYSINSKGKEYFEKLMLDELPTSPQTGFQCIKVKMLTLPLLKLKSKNLVLNDCARYYELAKVDIKNKVVTMEKTFGEYENDVLRHDLEILDQRLSYIKHLISLLNG